MKLLRRQSPEERRNVAAYRRRAAIHEAGHLIVALELGIPVRDARVYRGVKGGRVRLSNESLVEKRGYPMTAHEEALIWAAGIAAAQTVEPDYPVTTDARSDVATLLGLLGDETVGEAIECATTVLQGRPGERAPDLLGVADDLLAGRFKRPNVLRRLVGVFS